MRKNTSINSYIKVEELFKNNKKKSYSATAIRDITNIDYDSIKLILNMLLNKKIINKKENRYELKGEIK